ncbi:ABC transporter substrate-binding protein [Leptospira kobayashii]|uniref:ABC transporter substrate-binding protein n=1 Tax=Leptospira kobayashii TaxID=1917830 RepID=A0ABM7UKM4_9LEPT|nr:extracellular solute-binding protein [Leptospira kobayashii]BDA79453.1 ABC transporter substrate-binding protein [Leptospira kobayashii]
MRKPLLVSKIFAVAFLFATVFVHCSDSDSDSPGGKIAKLQEIPWTGDLNSIPPLLQAANPAASLDAKKGGRISIYSHQFPKSLNYYLDQFTTTARIFTSMFESLVIYHPLTLEPYPNLAKSWKISTDKRKFTFYLDQNAKWSDGKSVTADDVIFTYDTIMNPANATAVFRISLSRFAKPVKEDEFTVSFEAKEVHWNNFNDLASSILILPKHHFEGKDFNKENFEFPIVSGPYKLVESKKGRYVKLERRTDWWKRAYPFHKTTNNFDQVVYKVYNEETVALQAFKKGDIDVYPVYKASVWVEEAKGEVFDKNWIAKQRFFNLKPIGFQGWAMNTRRDIFKDKRVREAMAVLVDRKLMIDKLAYGEYDPTNSYYPDYYFGGEKNPNTPVEFNVEKARKLLSEAGWKPNAKGLLEKDGRPFKFTILDRDKSTEKYFTVFLEKAKEVGIDANIETTDLAAWSARVDKYDFDMTWAAWGSGVFKDPEAQWHSKYASEEGQPNLPGLKIPAVDALIEKQKAEFDLNKRNSIVKEIDKIIYKEYPYVLLWHLPSTRILYWRKFSAPTLPLGKYGTEDFVTDYWWFDETADSQLKEAMSSKKALGEYKAVIPWTK